MHHLFIINPAAGPKNSTAALEKQIAELTFDHRVLYTTAEGDAQRFTEDAAALGEPVRVYACGGDGTFNECVCGAARLDNVAVCPFPTGTGNDFCRMFGEEKDLYRDLDALLNGWEHPIDLIDCNGRYSANICSVGIDARIGTSVHKYSKLPLIGGATGYVVSLIVNVFKGITRKMRIRAEGFSAEGSHTLVCACNGRFYGGGFNPSLDARPDDGIMDIFIVDGVSLLHVAALIGKYASGRSDEAPKYIHHLKTDAIDIDFEEENVVNVDGETLFTDKVRMRLIPGALKLIVPKGMKFFDK